MKVGIYLDLPLGHFVRTQEPWMWAGTGGPFGHLRAYVDRSDGTPLMGLEDFRSLVEWGHENGVAVSPVFWPRRTWTQEQWRRAHDIATAASGPPVLDIEHQARRPSTRRAICDASRQAFGSLNQVVITTHPAHSEVFPESRTWDRPSERYEIQAYSTASNVKAHGARGPQVYPRRYQRAIAATRWPDEMALALYGQDGLEAMTGWNAHQSLEDAFEAACGRVDTVTYWSYKHLVRIRYAKTFVHDVLAHMVGNLREHPR